MEQRRRAPAGRAVLAAMRRAVRRQRTGAAPSESLHGCSCRRGATRATSGWTSDQLTDDAPSAASRMTVGVPTPAHARCSLGPPTSMREPGGLHLPVSSSRRIVAGFLTITSRLATTPTVTTNTVVHDDAHDIDRRLELPFQPGPENYGS